MQRFQVRVHIELVLGSCATLLILDGGKERAEAVNLHLLRIEQHLQQTTAELLHHAVHHVGRVNRPVLADVVRKLAGVQTLQILHASVVLAVSGRMLVLVLVHFIDNLRHNK